MAMIVTRTMIVMLTDIGVARIVTIEMLSRGRQRSISRDRRTRNMSRGQMDAFSIIVV